MKQILDDEYTYPIADCPHCGTKGVPFNIWWHNTDDGYVKSVYCLNCHEDSNTLVNLSGYASMIELEDMEWDTEL